MKSVFEALWPIVALMLYCFLVWRLILFVQDEAAGTFWASKAGGIAIFVGVSLSLFAFTTVCDLIAKRRNSN